MGNLLIIVGALLLGIGLLLKFMGKVGVLPGDMFIQKGNVTFFFPIVTCIVLSIVITIIMNLFRR